jgi:hypothetical protein
MDIDQLAVQKLQSGMESLHERKEAAKQTVVALLHAPTNQMAISPILALTEVAAESIMSPCPHKVTAPTPTLPSSVDPSFLAIMAALTRIQGTIDSLDKRVTAVETPTSVPWGKKLTPGSASAVSMPPKPANPTIDPRAKTKAPQFPKPTTLVPATPPPT